MYSQKKIPAELKFKVKLDKMPNCWGFKVALPNKTAQFE
jgi:hypothetical protein